MCVGSLFHAVGAAIEKEITVREMTVGARYLEISSVLGLWIDDVDRCMSGRVLLDKPEPFYGQHGT